MGGTLIGNWSKLAKSEMAACHAGRMVGLSLGGLAPSGSGDPTRDCKKEGCGKASKRPVGVKSIGLASHAVAPHSPASGDRAAWCCENWQNMNVFQRILGSFLLLLGGFLAFVVYLGPQYEGWRLQQVLYGGIPALLGAIILYEAEKK